MAHSEQEVYEKFLWAGVQENTARVAASKVVGGETKLVAITGKMASGKDTVAPLFMKRIVNEKQNITHEYFAKPLKDEVTKVIVFLRESQKKAQEDGDLDWPMYQSLSADMTKMFAISSEQADQILEFLLPEMLLGEEYEDSYVRTPGVRRALQHWGTDIRRAQDSDYWVKKALNSIANGLAQGNSVYITDLRFLNEADALRSINGYIVRIVVNEQIQAERLYARDKLVLEENTKNHISETDLDTYPNFNIVVENNIDGKEALKNLIDNLVDGYKNY